MRRCDRVGCWPCSATATAPGTARPEGAVGRGGVGAFSAPRWGGGDPPMEAAVNEAYAREAPELLDPPQQHSPGPTADWMTTELAGSPLFEDVTQRDFRRI